MNLLIQLERLGDIAQSRAAFQLAVASGEECVVLVHEAYGELARQILPEGLTLRTASPESVVRIQQGLKRDPPAWQSPAEILVAELELPRPRRVINLGWDSLGLACATAVGGEIWGGRFSSAGERLFPGPWASYVLTATDVVPHGRIHLGDLRGLLAARAFGLEHLLPLSAPLSSATDRPVAAPRESAPTVVVSASSSQAERCLPPEMIGGLASILKDAGYRVVVNATAAEAEHAARIVAASGGQAENLSGQLDLPALWRLLGSAALVVGTDTGPLHLACAQGTPVVMALIGRSQVWATGPISAGSVAIQGLPVGEALPASIPSQLLEASCRAALAGGDALDDLPPGEPGQAELLLPAPAPAGDPLGGVVYRRPGSGVDGCSLQVRATLATLAALPVTPPGDTDPGLAPVARAILRGAEMIEGLCAGAIHHIEAGRSLEAARALEQVSPLMDQIVGASRAIPALAPVCFAARNMLDNLPPAGPSPTVGVFKLVAERLAQAMRLMLGPA